MTEQKKIIEELLLANKRLSAALGVFTKYHLIKSEKAMVMGKLEKCANEAQIEEALAQFSKDFYTTYAVDSSDSTWSPGFIAELLKYYEEQLGFNPIERIKENFDYIALYFQLKKKGDLSGEELEAQAGLDENIPELIKNVENVFNEFLEKK